jgi:hypothetical protein
MTQSNETRALLRILVGVAVLFVVGTCTACRARPKRFSNLRVLQSPIDRVIIPPNRFLPLSPPTVPDVANAAGRGRSIPLPTAGPTAALASYFSDRYSAAFQYRRNPWRLHGSGFPAAGLFCGTCPLPPEVLSASVFAVPAPPVSAETKSAAVLKLAEKAQAEVIEGFFALTAKGTKASDVMDWLAKQLNDVKEAAKPSNPARPRVELTISQLLSLPGEWERVQYMAVFFVLHSADVAFVDTNEFENSMRDIELGKFTQTATNGLTASGNTGFGNSPPTATISRPGSATVSGELKYVEALERQLKEQLQFRSSSLDLGGRVLGIVMKSSQQNKLPTLVRQIVTLQYLGALDSSAKGRILRAEYQADALASIGFADEVRRPANYLAASDEDVSDRHTWKTMATPVLIAVVRRVRNATGVNTSLEDDDDVEYVTQARVLDPVKLDEPSKCQYTINVGKRGDKLYIIPPGEPFGKQAVLVEYASAEKFALAVRKRIDAKIGLANGLLFADPAPLAGYKLRYGDSPSSTSEDWSMIHMRDVVVSSAACR